MKSRWVKGNFWTLCYQIDQGARRLLWIGKDRTGHSLETNTNDRRRMRDLMGSGLRTLRAFLLVESFEHLGRKVPSTPGAPASPEVTPNPSRGCPALSRPIAICSRTSCGGV